MRCQTLQVQEQGWWCPSISRFEGHAATSNLKTHAIRCFGADAVNAAFNKPTSGSPDGSIFASFARLGQASVSISHRAHTTDETRYVFIFDARYFSNYPSPFRAHLARWCAESNRPMHLVRDREFLQLMNAGCPGTSIPTPMTVGRDILLLFEKCRERIKFLR